MERTRVLLYGDVNLNIIDGSAIWLTSMAEVLVAANCDVTILIKNKIVNDRLIRRLNHIDRITFVDPWGDMRNHSDDEALSPRFAAQRMLQLHSHKPFDAVVIRGYSVSKFVTASQDLSSISWIYITDLPTPARNLSLQNIEDLRKVCRGAFRLFAQTEDARSYLESLAPEAAGKTCILSPMVPDELFNQVGYEPSGSELSLVYSGKFAQDWNTKEMLKLPSELSARGRNSTLTMIGDKFQKSKSDPKWHMEMRDEIDSHEGITWLGGMARSDAMREVAKHHVGIGWRSSKLDSSMEISTKALEYAALGVPPILNRTRAHEYLFGKDYPLFVDSSFKSVLEVLAQNPLDLEKARLQARSAAQFYSFSAAAERISQYFARSIPRTTAVKEPIRILIAGHDLKFAGELIELFDALPSVTLSVDKWESLHKHDAENSRRLLEDADIVICEWCGPNAVWFSENKLENQKLFIRLHAFELRGSWLANINISNVDQVFCVSELYKKLTIETTGWDPKKISVISNLLDTVDLNRPKLPGSQFRLGLIGIVPFIKRPDRAIYLLERLLAQDPRFTLHIRGRMPWEYSYEWNKGIQREAYEEFFSTIGKSKTLAKSVVFEPFGADIASWLRKIGYVLSPSSRESFHMAPMEGMASGAIPIVWDRPGSVEIFGEDFVVGDTDEAYDKILQLSNCPSEYSRFSEAAQMHSLKYDSLSILNKWLEAIMSP